MRTSPLKTADDGRNSALRVTLATRDPHLSRFVSDRQKDVTMPNNHGRTTEYEMSVAVLRYLSHQPNYEASHKEIRAAIPHYVKLTDGDMEDSPSRPGERLWEQIARNIQSHKETSTNFINLGLLDHVPGGGFQSATLV